MASINDNGMDIEWLLLLEMGDTVSKLSDMAGVDLRSTVIGDGIEIKIEDRNPQASMMSRLKEVLGAVTALSGASKLGRDDACRELLLADGWSLTRRNLRAPLWMWKHEEISREDAAVKFKELRWLEKYM